jgi:hypothetical protein
MQRRSDVRYWSAGKSKRKIQREAERSQNGLCHPCSSGERLTLVKSVGCSYRTQAHTTSR